MRSPFWYMGAVFIAVGSWIVGTVVAAGAWDVVREASPVAIETKADAKDHSLAVFTDLLQPDRQVTCVAVGPGKDQTTDIKASTLDLVVDDEGNQWHLIGFDLDSRDGITVRCTPKDKAVDNATYAYSVVEGFDSRITLGNVIMYVGTAVALGIAIASFLARRKATQALLAELRAAEDLKRANRGKGASKSRKPGKK